MKQNDLPLGRINESNGHIKKLGYSLKPEFAYSLNLCPWHIRQCKYYKGLFYLFYNGLKLYVDCNHCKQWEGVGIPAIAGSIGGNGVDISGVKNFFLTVVKEYLIDHTDHSEKITIITFEEVEEMGLVEDLKRKHEEQKPGRNIWTPQVGEVRVLKIQDKRFADVVISGQERKSPIFDVLDIETEEEFAVWGYARLDKNFEKGKVFVVEYNGKKDEGHSFWLTDVTKEYQAGVKKGK